MGDKVVLVKSLRVLVKTESTPDVVLVDSGQLFYSVLVSVPSAKDHERIRRGKAKEVRLPANTPLPCREAILHKQESAQQLSMPV